VQLKLALLITVVMTNGAALGETFTPGDLYLLTSAWPGAGSAVGRIDPVTGDTVVFHDFATYPRAGRATYDPYRDRLVIMPDINDSYYRFIAADGSYTDLDNDWDPDIASWCPTGDGRIYLLAGVGTMAYLDADDVRHVLFDTDGMTPFGMIGILGNQHMIYDARTNSLFIAHWGQSTQVWKIPLSADGTRVVGPPVTVEFDAFENEADEPMGISAGPNGAIFIKIRAASNDVGLLMFLVDPVTLQFEPFAYIQHHFSAWNRPATYDSTHGIAFAIDEWNDHVRTYVDSDTVQAGGIHASGVSSVGALTFLLSVGDTINGHCGADTDGSGAVDFADLLALLAAWGPYAPCPPYIAEDIDRDCSVGFGDLLAMLAAWGPCG
jgi:hypothetical protein